MVPSQPSQINVINPEGEAPYTAFTEDISKTNQGGLKSRKISPKSVIHHVNLRVILSALVYKSFNSINFVLLIIQMVLYI